MEAVALGWFALGTVSFWAITIVLVGILFFCVEAEDGALMLGFVSVIIALLIVWLIGGLPVWRYIVEQPYSVLGWLAAYLGTGVLWSFLKWDRYTSNLAKKIKEASKKGRSVHSIDKSDFAASGRKELICTWITYWPWSFVWTFAREIIIKGIENLFELLKSSYDRVSRRHYAKVEEILNKED